MQIGLALLGGRPLATGSLRDTTKRALELMARRFRFAPDGRWIASFGRGGGGAPHLVVRACPEPGAARLLDHDGFGGDADARLVSLLYGYALG